MLPFAEFEKHRRLAKVRARMKEACMVMMDSTFRMEPTFIRFNILFKRLGVGPYSAHAPRVVLKFLLSK